MGVKVDRDLEAFVPLFPPADLSDPVTARTNLAKLAASAPPPDAVGMKIEDRTVPADPDVPVRIYRPLRAHGAILWLHGGGFVMGDLETEHPWAVRVADGSGAVVVSVGYRLAPEHPLPAAVDDAYAALAWTAEHATELGVDPTRIAVGGHAAGAGLAAAVALRARNQQGPSLAFQLLNQPELDDRQESNGQARASSANTSRSLGYICRWTAKSRSYRAVCSGRGTTVSPKETIRAAAEATSAPGMAPAHASTPAPRALISSPRHNVSGRPVTSAMIRVHSGLRLPPPIARSTSTRVPVTASSPSRCRRSSNATPSISDR
jgi:acetyl esterase/lipase